MSSVRREYLWATAVCIVAVWYFRLGIGLSLEWSDEGQIVYPSWQVARGALPYRDFLQAYGPSVFFFNGGLLHLFGPDLGVLLAALVLIKTAVAALAYAGARLVAPRAFALGAVALLIAIWGMPLWVFSTPYPNHYSTALILAGLVAVAATRRRFLTTCAFAGVCFGVAATFKQTAGLFACMGLGLAVLSGCTLGAHRSPAGAEARGDAVVRGLRLAFLAGAFGVAVTYLAPAGTLANACVLGAPLGAGLAVLGAGEIRGDGDAALRRRGLAGLVLIGMGAAIPVALCAGYFAFHGVLRELAFNTIVGLPHLVRWFDPVALPPGPSVMLVVAIVAGLALVVASPHRAAGRAAGAVMVLGAVIALAVADLTGDGLALVLHALTLLLFVIAWGGLAAIVVDRPRERPPARELAPAGEGAVAIFAFAAAAAVLLLYPAGDYPHVVMAWPLFVPILAHLLWRWYSAAAAAGTRRWRIALRALLAGLLAALGAPFVGMLADRSAQSAGAARFARAAGVIATDRKSADAAQVIDYLAQQPDGPLLVLSNEQMLYFLAGRDSVVAPYEFALYLVGAGLIPDADAHRLLDDAGFDAQLETQRPLVVDHPGPMTARLRGAYPGVARTLAAHYRPVYRAGIYEVLRWSD